MAKVLNFYQVIRNNWKKSVVGAIALSYGVSYSKDAYEVNQLMRQYCENVVKDGDASIPTHMKPHHVTVILNPSAGKGKAKKLFTNYCEPLLHLAGIAVTVIQTEQQNEARKIIMNLDTPTDAIIVAGGDGTLSDVLTGLVRKYNRNLSFVKQCPIGILPLGEKNRIARSLYTNIHYVQELVEATMAIINQKSKMMDVIEIEPLEQEDPENPIKPIYAAGSVEWGAWRDAHASRNKYWYWGSLRKYATYIFSGYKSNLNWDCNAIIKYSDPCTGCSYCYKKDPSLTDSVNTNRRWWHAFVTRQRTVIPDVDYSNVTNEMCNVFHEIPVSTTELHIETSNVNTSKVTGPPSIKVKMGPKNISYLSFIGEGWKLENDNELLKEDLIEAKDIELIPQKHGEERSFFIDNEKYELKAVKIKLLSQAIRVLCPEPKS